MTNYFDPSNTDHLRLLPRELRDREDLPQLLDVARLLFEQLVDTDTITGYDEDGANAPADLQIAVRWTLAQSVAELMYRQRDENIEEVETGPRTVTYFEGKGSHVYDLIRRFEDPTPIYHKP